MLLLAGCSASEVKTTIRMSVDGTPELRYSVAVPLEEMRGETPPPEEEPDLKGVDLTQSDAEALYERGLLYLSTQEEQNFSLAHNCFLKAAELGHVSSQFNLGVLYSQGKGVHKDDIKAFTWYLRAAEQGHVKAQYNVGVAYEDGLGAGQDYQEAARWYAISAEGGYPSAQFNLGNFYIQGLGVPQSATKAYEFFLLAARGGHTKAQLNLGVMYLEGQGVAHNHEEGYAWMVVAAESGDWLANQYRTRIEELETSDVIDRGKLRARELLADIDPF